MRYYSVLMTLVAILFAVPTYSRAENVTSYCEKVETAYRLTPNSLGQSDRYGDIKTIKSLVDLDVSTLIKIVDLNYEMLKCDDSYFCSVYYTKNGIAQRLYKACMANDLDGFISRNSSYY